MKHKPKTIEEIGLENYLNVTKSIHNDFGYDDFRRMCESEVNATNIGRAFNVDRRTATKWLIIYEKVLANEE